MQVKKRREKILVRREGKQISDYSKLAMEFMGNIREINNIMGIGEVKSVDPISIVLPDITLDQDDIILSDGIKNLITPIIPDIDGDCTIKEDMYKDNQLKSGDKVLVQSIEDGQKFIIIDRIYL